MSNAPQFRRAGPIVAMMALAAWGCSDAPTSSRKGEMPSKASFAAGGSISVNLDQCANNVPRGGNCTWQNGDLNGSNSQYAEGLTVPFRLSIDGLTVGTQYTFHINYDWTAGGHKAYDFLASFNATEQVDKCSAGGGGTPLRCGGAAGAGLGAASTFAIPENSFPIPNVGGVLSIGSTTILPSAISWAASGAGGGQVTAGERVLTLYGGTINSMSDPTHLDNKGNAVDAGDLTGNTEADAVVVFTANQSSVLFLWSGHLAQSSYWDRPGAPNGAGQVSGAPWHMRTQQLGVVNGASAGNKNQDRSIQPSALLQPPAMTLAKNADAATVNAGDQIGFTVTVTNNGPGDAVNVVVTDALPSGGALSWTESPDVTECSISGGTLTCTYASIAAGTSKTVHVVSPTSSANCGTINNQATATVDNGASPSPANASVTVNCPDVKVEKTAVNGTINAGDLAKFTITVTSLGPGTAKGVTLTDNLPSGLSWSENPDNTSCSITNGLTLSCDFGDLASGQVRTVSVEATTTKDNCGQLSNTATVSATNEAAAQQGNNSSTASITVNCAQIQITKVADQGTVSAGTTIGFTITVKNNGAGTANTVTVSDALPANSGLNWSIDAATSDAGCSISAGVLTCNFGSLAQSASKKVHITSPTTAASCGAVDNTASVTTSNDGSANANASVTVNCADINITKAADQAIVSAGTAIGFVITASNAGAGTASGVTVTDNLPSTAGLSWTIDAANSDAGCSISAGVLTCNFGSLANGASKHVHITSPTTASSCGTVNNTAQVTTSNDGSAQSSASVTVNCAEIHITKLADQSTVSAGTSIGFVITASNTGAGDATGVTVNDNLPTNSGLSWSIDAANSDAGCSISSGKLTCTFNTLASGASKHVHITSPTTSASCGTVDNTAQVTTTNDGSAQSQTSVTVNCPTIGITKTADQATVSAGTSIGFVITASNTGTGDATGVTVSDNLPTNSGLSWSIDAAGSDAGCSITAGVLTCSFGTLVGGTSKHVHITSPTTSATCGSVNNTARVTTTNDGSAQANASVTVTCPNLTITKTPDKTGDVGYVVNPGGTATFKIVVSNTGSGAATNTVITDTLPSGLTWTSDKPAQCTITSQILTCNVGTLAANGSFTVNVSATIPNDFLVQGPSASGTALEIDGNLVDGAAAGKDWASIGIDCTSTPKVGCDIDKPTGTTDDSFGQGTKEDTPVPTVVAGSIPNNKSDLLRFYVATERFVTTDFLYLAWERVQAPNGTTNMDFELNQSSQKSGNDVTPVRTAGDILIKYDLAKGGTTPVLGFHRWVTASGAACEASGATPPCWGPVTALTVDVAGAINTGSVSDPIQPNAPRSLDALTFGEASIDLEAAGIFQPGVCLNFGQAYLKSRSSDSFTSEIKDFIAPIPISVSNCQDKFLDNLAWVKASNFLPAAGISDSGHIKVTESQSASAARFTPVARERLAVADGAGSLTTDMVASVANAVEPTPRVTTPVDTRRRAERRRPSGMAVDPRHWPTVVWPGGAGPMTKHAS